MQHIEAVCAFIELPVYLNNPEEIQAGIGLSAHFMQGTSAAARYGVIGECLNPADDPDIIENLRTMRVVSTEQTFKDQQMDETHLLITALMTADFLERRGQSLQPGDLISVGALSGNPRGVTEAASPGGMGAMGVEHHRVVFPSGVICTRSHPLRPARCCLAAKPQIRLHRFRARPAGSRPAQRPPRQPSTAIRSPPRRHMQT